MENNNEMELHTVEGEPSPSVTIDLEEPLYTLPKSEHSESLPENPYTIDAQVFEPGNETLLHKKIDGMIVAQSDQTESVENVSIENNEAFEKLDVNEIIAKEAGVAAQAVMNSVKEGKIEGVSVEDAEQPGFMEGFLETPIGKKLMNSVKAMMLATALVVPMESAQADTMGDLSRAAETWGNQKVDSEARKHETDQQREANFELRQQEMESRIANERSTMEARFKSTTAQKNAEYKYQLSQVNSAVDKEKITARQDRDWETFVSRVQMERTQFEDRTTLTRTQFASDVLIQRQRAEIEKQSQDTRINTQVGGQVVRTILNNVLKR